jgi:hypothetical protein
MSFQVQLQFFFVRCFAVLAGFDSVFLALHVARGLPQDFRIFRGLSKIYFAGILVFLDSSGILTSSVLQQFHQVSTSAVVSLRRGSSAFIEASS